MPENKPTKVTVKEEDTKWITVGGKKIPIKPGEDVEDKTREKLPSARGEKESGTKEARKSFTKRFNIIKTPFSFRDEVLFDKFEKSGILYGFDGDYVKVKASNGHYDVLKSDTFKKSEMLGDTHWDVMSNEERYEALKKSSTSDFYINRDWALIPEVVRDHMVKNLGPAGYEGGVSTHTAAVYNPVNDDKSVGKRIKEALNQKGKNEEKRDNS